MGGKNVILSSGEAMVAHILGPALNMDFLRDLVRLARIVLPGFWSKEFGLLWAHTTTLIVRTFLSIYVAGLEGRMVKHIVKRDKVY